MTEPTPIRLLLALAHFAALLLAAGLGAAWIGLAATRRRERPAPVHVAALAAIWGVLVLSVAVLLLADLGAFRIQVLDGLAAALGAAGLVARRRCLAGLPPEVRGDGRGAFLAIPVVLLAALLCARPHEYMKGGWDPGIYTSIAGHLARSGSLLGDDPLLREVSKDAPVVFYQRRTRRHSLYPGFFVADPARGVLRPSYYHLYPAWAALHILVFGSRGVFHANCLPAVAAAFLLFLYVRRAFSTPAAALACAFLLLSPAQIYFTRYQSTETLTQFLFFAAVWALAWSLREEDRPDVFGEITAAACIAAGFLVHATSALPAVLLIATWLVFGAVRRKPVYLRFPALALALFLAAFARNWVQCHTVTYRLARGFFRRYRLIALGLGAAAAVAWPAVQYLRRRRDDLARFGVRLAPAAGYGAAAMIAAVAFYGYFLRPRLAAGPEADNLVLLGRLISPVAVALAVAAFFLYPPHRWSLTQALFIVPAAVTTVLIVRDKMIAPVLMYAARRYVAFLVPLVAVLAAAALAALFRRERGPWRAAAALLAACVLGYEAYAALPSLRVREERGLADFYAAIARQVADADLVMCDHQNHASPLRFICGLPAYQVSRQHEATGPLYAARRTAWFRRWVGAGRKVYYVADTPPFFDPAFHLDEVGRVDQPTERLHRKTGPLPREIVKEIQTARIYRLAGNETGSGITSNEYVLPVAGHAFGLIGGFFGLRESGEERYRWTDGAAELYVPCYGEEADTEITLRMAAKRPGKDGPPVPVEVRVEDRPLATLDVTQDWADYVVTVPRSFFSSPSPRRAVKLGIHCDTWNPADHGIEGFATHLGVRLSSVRVRALR